MACLYPHKLKHKNGTVSKIYYIQYKENGVTRTISTKCRNKADANIFFKDFNPKKRSNFNLKALERECNEYARINLKQKMQNQYRSTLSKFIQLTGNKSLSEVNKLNIQNYIKDRQSQNSRCKKPYSPCSINIEIAVLKRAFEIAVENNWLEVNPARKVKKLPVPKRRPEFSIDEVHLLLSALNELPDKRYYLAFKMAVNTGMRRNEICSLKWEQIDLKKGIINLSNKITKKPEFVSINPAVNDILLTVERNISGQVFGLSSNYLYEVVKKQIKKLGLNSRLVFHSTRHTFITEAVNGFGIHIAKDMARQSDITMTNKYYHGNEEKIKECAKSLVI